MSGDPNRDDDDTRDDEPTDSAESDVLVLETSDRQTVFGGAVLVGGASYSASHTLAVRAAGSFPAGGALTAVLTLIIFAAGVVLLVEGAAGIVAEKNADS